MKCTLPLLLLFLVTGCSRTDANTQTWLDQLRPLLHENSVLAERVLGVASGVYNQTAPSKEVAQQWRNDVIPLADHLYAQASIVEPPTPYSDRHKELVEIWGDRATAYRTLSEAITLADVDRWDHARNQIDHVKLREEEWSRTVNTALGKQGASIKQFP